MNGNLFSVVVLGICVATAISSVAQAPCERKDLKVLCDKLRKEEEPSKADKSSTPPVSCPSGTKHSVTLSWNASTSLSSFPVEGEGYNLYRRAAGGECKKIELVKHSFYEDCQVDAGEKYRYTVTAIKQNAANQSCESEISNVVEAWIPEP
jgi:hypothetical protein